MRVTFPLIFWSCAFCLVFASGGDTCNDQSYNNAWKALEMFESGYIKYVTFDTSLRCPSVKRLSLDEETQTAHYVGTLNTKDDETIQRFNMTLIAGKTCSSSLDISYDGDLSRTETVNIVYTDFQYCSVDAYPGEEQQCRYWVATGATEEQSQSCEEHVTDQCGTKRNLLYDEASCAADAGQ